MADFDLERAARTIAQRLPLRRPLVVAIDGRSGVGKSTFARRLASRLGAMVVEGDDFFSGGVELRTDAVAARVDDCIDWRHQRLVLAALRSGRSATWHPFDWEAFDGSRSRTATACAPRPVVLLEGVYSARPELADLVDLRILLRVPEEARLARLHAREGVIGPWERQWHEAEEHYFGKVVQAAAFHLQLSSD